LQVKNGGGVKKIQLYGQAGIDQTPQPDDVAIKMLVGESQTAIVATADQVPPETAPGETRLYSYDENATVKAEIWIYVDGKIIIKNNNGKIELNADGTSTVKSSSQSLATLIGELIDDIVGMSTFGPPPKHAVFPVDVTKFNALKTKFQSLLKD
jgi:hypothetical protein